MKKEIMHYVPFKPVHEKKTNKAVADPEGVQEVHLNPIPSPVFKYPIKIKYLALVNPQLFYFYFIFYFYA